VEDTIKKSKEILAAAYNVKNPDKSVTPDDKVSPTYSNHNTVLTLLDVRESR
jgi:hypothetical protein